MSYDGPPAAVAVAIGTTLWPVGSIFVSVVATNPAVLLGFGTWTAFGSGRVLIGLDVADEDFDTAEETGGAKSHTHAAGTYIASAPAFTGTPGTVPAQTISWPAGVPTAANESAHTHSTTLSGNTGSTAISGTASTAVVLDAGAIGADVGVAAQTHTHPSHAHTMATGPFTSGAGSAHSHTISWPGGVPTNNTVSFTPSGTNSAPSISGASAYGSNIPPYVVGYRWKRTA